MTLVRQSLLRHQVAQGRAALMRERAEVRAAWDGDKQAAEGERKASGWRAARQTALWRVVLRDEMFAPTIYNKAPYIPSVGDHALVITAMDTVTVDPTDYACLPVLPEIEELKKFIESDSQMYMIFNQMFMDDNKWFAFGTTYTQFFFLRWNLPRTTPRFRTISGCSR
ncbi:hypothetical protein DFH09DRAFT_1086016 [Mycena vulgaris]|nr:hypothetical protein DFH09DRAFT_1086016 [Mycena vulgaris]